jgi:hypothetical protein
MFLNKTLKYETSESIDEVTRRMREVVETKDEPNELSHYKGEFVKQGFMLVRKTSAVSMPGVYIFGRYIEVKNRLRIVITIQLPTIEKIIFWVFNLILVFQLVARYLSSAKNWPLFLVFLVFLWLFFQFQLWLEAKMLRSMLDPLFGRQVKTNG